MSLCSGERGGKRRNSTKGPRPGTKRLSSKENNPAVPETLENSPRKGRPSRLLQEEKEETEKKKEKEKKRGDWVTWDAHNRLNHVVQKKNEIGGETLLSLQKKKKKRIRPRKEEKKKKKTAVPPARFVSSTAQAKEKIREKESRH